ncbi:hypothetical protein [Halococcus sediminicola]|uniref:hypothetical protein n=1 Tax=Halococcus sediminicola TaxID=1264579 RepID=UPI0006791A52|nr:hypothetical protein [Halococcus sediminicola]
MRTNQPQSLRSSVDSTSATLVGGFCLLLGVWMLVMTGYLWAAIPMIVAGAVAFPLTRPIVTLGQLRVGRHLHDFVSLLLWAALVFATVLVARPWV